MDHFVRTLFISDCRMTRREVRGFSILSVAADEPLDGEVSVMGSERTEWLFLVRKAMTGKVHPPIPAQLLRDPGGARFSSLGAHERCEAPDALADIRQFGTDGKKLGLVGSSSA